MSSFTTGAVVMLRDSFWDGRKYYGQYITFHTDESKKGLFTLVISVRLANFNMAKR